LIQHQRQPTIERSEFATATAVLPLHTIHKEDGVALGDDLILPPLHFNHAKKL